MKGGDTPLKSCWLKCGNMDGNDLAHKILSFYSLEVQYNEKNTGLQNNELLMRWPQCCEFPNLHYLS